MFKDETEQEFPEYRKTPPRIQRIINECTAEHRDHVKNGTGIIRRGSETFPRHLTGADGMQEASKYEAAKATKDMWQNVVADMKLYLAAKSRWKTGTASEEDTCMHFGISEAATFVGNVGWDY